ncbi:MAG TPA: type III-A CRISPR-associated protein Csm2 [Candidatus Alectryocaccomicrobium excrementavium]|uniref:CRISPR system Cms protein Csm2 n=1 Tax=Candidatus Alectryocaccomicrobium excrementavium TaxID=2840668 RepID=A0A9D1G0T0_9FIRM|nr:type III-A CRISPR-associated protein Csm2 [Candidatus Alectryocaccomicrobium excrementavium]
MAARDNYGQGYGGRSTYNPWGPLQGKQGQSAPPAQSAPPPKKAFNDGKPEALPANFVDEAQAVMNRIAKYSPDKNGQDRWTFKITTSKIRKLLSLVMDIYNAECRRTEETLLEKSALAVQMARAHIVYEAGRDDDVRQFVEASKLLPYIKGIGNSRANLIRYTQYLEALVAYHRYMGGREN